MNDDFKKESIMLKSMGAIVAIFFALSVSSNAYAKRYMVKEFNYVDKVGMQQVTQSCWTDAIEMIVNTHGINWNQDDVVKAVKGAINLKSVQVSEVSLFLNNWSFDYAGEKWSTSSQYYEGALPEESIRNEIDNGRPIITSTSSSASHIVIVYGYSLQANDKDIDTIYYFDPHELRSNFIEAWGFKHHTQHSWTLKVTK